MLTVWFAGLVLLPLLGGVTLLIAGRRLSPRVGRWIALSIAGWATVSAAVLMAFGEQVLPVQFTWLPGAGAITFTTAATGLRAAFATAAAAFFALLITPAYEAPTPASSALALLALAAANAAFLSAHFLGRYVALETVGVCIALVPLLARAGDVGARLARFVYLVLRVGDTGFLVAMLMLMHAADTLDITPALEAGATLSAPRLTWVILGFTLAVWVKIGAWPFGAWQQVGESCDFATHTWTYATVMPNLGLYLLYRITPLLAWQPALQTGILWLALGGMVLTTLLAWLRRDLRPALAYLSAAESGLALCLAAGGQKTLVATLLLVMTFLRLLFLWGGRAVLATESRPRARRLGAALIGLGGLGLTGFNGYFLWRLAQATVIPWPVWGALGVLVLLMGGRYGAAAIGGWAGRLAIPWEPTIPTQALALDRGLNGLAQGARAWLEVGLLERLMVWAPRGLIGLAEGAHTWFEVGVLERLVAAVPRVLIGGAARLQDVEENGLEGALHGTTDGAFAFSRWVQARHTGRLRVNLQWVLAALVLIVAMLVWQGW
ncbi:MAG TPA: proton-conducting transporter membrane subunit [Anaerolineae bacterium]|nr:proton-conducting transporter membrane subunit [Anaerolineae bacterium]